MKLQPESVKSVFLKGGIAMEAKSAEANKHHIAKLEANLAGAAVEMEKAKAQLV